MNTVVEVKNLTKEYNNNAGIHNLEFRVEQGEIFGILGHNGAGKTTTMECILGLKKEMEGQVKILGMDPIADRKKLFEQVGVQLQASNFQDHIRVNELCEELSALYQHPLDYRILLQEFSLEKFCKQPVESLSGGERQKLSILLALLVNPKLIVLDELTTGLDTLARRKVWKTLLDLKEKGLTILLTSHYMDEVERLCDRVLILKEGREVASGTVKEMIQKSPYQSLEDAYLWYMGEEAAV
ncbi:ABC transporter, ATP-binding protein [Lachnospiraceae bacterium KM106-2]|nr:ABC transporter, ATP-binding protein [Lachnospiraceae bacterium KM106-2]